MDRHFFNKDDVGVDDDVDYANDHDDDDDHADFEQRRRRRQCANCHATYEDDAGELRRLCPRCVTFRYCRGCKRRLPDSSYSTTTTTTTTTTTANDDHTYHRVLCLVSSRVNNLLVIN